MVSIVIDSTTYTGRMFLHLPAALAEWEHDRISAPRRADCSAVS